MVFGMTYKIHIGKGVKRGILSVLIGLFPDSVASINMILLAGTPTKSYRSGGNL